ncbi:fumarylacetoacetate hydrolase family protein [Natronomonas salsuginis]|uniref:Fumarylacetoacetate hydrolase family protein n=1 Tax=Natronomonas salsuginis TaxID=2217661 RepID=A0A4U5JNR5_9EURY|nr:fumarylacetoacetate hydrolase family protein [Natronomonas salsuginis]TKR27849.1 fumarylacetoacetate hydrolase family protein [Natronomonas salsuginis]
MRQIRFRDPDGDVRYGELIDDGTIRADPIRTGRVTDAVETFEMESIEVLPPCDPSKIVCVGRNYADHAEEMGNEIPDRPLLFLKSPNAVASHGSTVELLTGIETLDHEAELGVVIAERCRHVSADDADGVIAGYTCVNDISNRDDQRRETNWVRGKSFDDSAPIGPVIAAPENVPDDASVRCRVNGELRQDGSRDQFIFSVPELIEEITAYMTLEAGDVISTGTPEGVGPLADGDTVEIEVEGVGTLENQVRIP